MPSTTKCECTDDYYFKSIKKVCFCQCSINQLTLEDEYTLHTCCSKFKEQLGRNFHVVRSIHLCIQAIESDESGKGLKKDRL